MYGGFTKKSSRAISIHKSILVYRGVYRTYRGRLNFLSYFIFAQSAQNPGKVKVEL